MGKWREGCEYAPKNKYAKHCEATNNMKPNYKENKGKKGALPKKSKIRGTTGKGYYGCANHCPLYKQKGEN